MKLLSIIIPVYNEEDTVVQILERVRSVDTQCVGYEKELIIIDDGSRDVSALLIQKFIEEKGDGNTLFIQNKKNAGKGFVVKQGIKKASGDVYIIQDADLEYNPKDYIAILKKFKHRDIDFVYGSRILEKKKKANTYSHRRFLFGGRLVSRWTTILSGIKVTDEPTCYKAFRSHLKSDLLLPGEQCFAREPAVTMLLLRKGFSYAEVSIHYRARKIEHGKKIAWKDGVQALWTLLYWRMKSL